jgi:hypothetical protein
MFAMRQRVRRAVFGVAMIVGVTMPTALGAGVATGEEAGGQIAPTEQTLAKVISTGLTPAADGSQPQAIADTGSSSGSSLARAGLFVSCRSKG